MLVLTREPVFSVFVYFGVMGKSGDVTSLLHDGTSTTTQLYLELGLFFRTLLPSGAFRPFVVYSFCLPFFLHHMSSGSQSAGDAVVPKFDMHVNPSVLTSDEVNNLVVEYVIPLDLHPCIPPSGLTMNMLPADKIGLNRVTLFEIYCRSLEINPSVNLFRAFYKLNKQGHWFSFECRSGKGGHDKIFNEFCTSLKHWKDRFFLIDRRAIPDAMPWRHQDSSLADPSATGVRAEDIHRLCENVIDLRPVHPTMLYVVGLTTIWKHVGHHPVFKDGEGNDNVIVPPLFVYAA
ncbi:hypothetical protein Tco_0738351, partial [Tanacetum coccineum]